MTTVVLLAEGIIMKLKLIQEFSKVLKVSPLPIEVEYQQNPRNVIGPGMAFLIWMVSSS